MTKAREALKLILLFLLIALIGYLIMIAHRVVLLTDRADRVMIDVQKATAALAVSTAEQTARLRDPRNAKSLDAAIQTAAVFNATGRLLNSTTIPRVNHALESADATLTELTAATASLRQLVTDTSRSVNGELLPEASGAIRSATEAIDETKKVSVLAQDAIKIASNDIGRLLNDPAIGESTSQAARALKGLADTSERVAEASRQMPSIAASLEKIARTSSRYQKLLTALQTAAIFLRAFF